jgi:hypothetical protein
VTSFSNVRPTDLCERRKAAGAPFPSAWEVVTERLRKRLPEQPSLSEVFGRAGLRSGKAVWMRAQPDLRASVTVKLAKALKVPPAQFLRMMIRESKKSRFGEILF